MFAGKRQEEIAAAVTERGSVKVAELASHYGVTEDLIRKDLTLLELPDNVTSVSPMYSFSSDTLLVCGRNSVTAMRSRPVRICMRQACCFSI